MRACVRVRVSVRGLHLMTLISFQGACLHSVKHVGLCVCVCACVRARVRVCVCARARLRASERARVVCVRASRASQHAVPCA